MYLLKKGKLITCYCLAKEDVFCIYSQLNHKYKLLILLSLPRYRDKIYFRMEKIALHFKLLTKGLLFANTELVFSIWYSAISRGLCSLIMLMLLFYPFIWDELRIN